MTEQRVGDNISKISIIGGDGVISVPDTHWYTHSRLSNGSKNKPSRGPRREPNCSKSWT